MSTALRSILLTAPLLLAASMAHATFACEVLSAPTGPVHLRAQPEDTAASLAELPVGALVSLFDQEGDIVGHWVRVAYAQDDMPQWGAGLTGWVLSDLLADCG